MNTRLKQLNIALLSAALFVAAVPVQAGVPVFDGSAIPRHAMQMIEMGKQLKQMEMQYRAMTDNGNYTQLFSNPLVRKQLNKYLPNGYSDIFEAARRGDLGALEQVVNASMQKEKQAQTHQSGVERVAAVRLLTNAQMSGMITALNARSGRVQSLFNQINETANPAQKQDLMNTIAAEQAMISIDMNKMQIMMKQAEQQERFAERQAAKELQRQRYK